MLIIVLCIFIFKGGPCGVLASVQAFVLKKMLFEDPESVDAGPRCVCV